jgi:hypothetical protein
VNAKVHDKLHSFAVAAVAFAKSREDGDALIPLTEAAASAGKAGDSRG